MNGLSDEVAWFTVIISEIIVDLMHFRNDFFY